MLQSFGLRSKFSLVLGLPPRAVRHSVRGASALISASRLGCASKLCHFWSDKRHLALLSSWESPVDQQYLGGLRKLEQFYSTDYLAASVNGGKWYSMNTDNADNSCF